MQNLASVQQRASPVKFDDLAEKSKNRSISNLPTKVATAALVQFPVPPLTGFITVVHCQTGAALLARAGNCEAAVGTRNPRLPARHVSRIKFRASSAGSARCFHLFAFPAFLRRLDFDRPFRSTIASESAGWSEVVLLA